MIIFMYSVYLSYKCSSLGCQHTATPKNHFLEVNSKKVAEKKKRKEKEKKKKKIMRNNSWFMWAKRREGLFNLPKVVTSHIRKVKL